jgi:Fic family protein
MEKPKSDRVGQLARLPNGDEVFIPHKLAPNGPKIDIDSECLKLLDEADRALGELKGITETLPNPDLFIAFYVRKEALLSSQIEGTQCSLDEVLQVDRKTAELKPVQEVINYIDAMHEGLDSLKKIPVSLRLVNHIHSILLKGVRGKDKGPGEYKKIQNWIGPPGCKQNEATFIPPPPSMMIELMGDWEIYYQAETQVPPLIKAAILHAHFETIHPYTDGNGRLGRLLITFMLCEKKVLQRPLLYLSLFFKENRDSYYQLLMEYRLKGEIEGWIKYFLRGVRNASEEAIKTALQIHKLRNGHIELIKRELSKYRLALPFYDLICENPIISMTTAKKMLKTTYPSAKKIFMKFIDLGLLQPYGVARKRNKTFSYEAYLKILRRGT